MTRNNIFMNDYKQGFQCKLFGSIERVASERPAIDATRLDIIITKEPNPGDARKLIESLKVKKKLKQAIFQARFNGESYLILNGLKNNQNVSTGIGSIDVVNNLSYDNLTGMYRDGNNQWINKSRVFNFFGAQDENGKPQKCYAHVQTIINRYYKAVNSAALLLDKSTIPVIQIPELNRAMGGNEREKIRIKEKASAIAENLNNENVLMLDAADSFNTQQRSIAGLLDTTSELRAMLGGALLPELILFDRPPQGLSGSRTEQLEHYYGIVESIQEDEMMQVINTIFNTRIGQDLVEWQYAKLKPIDETSVEAIKTSKVTRVQIIEQMLALGQGQLVDLLKSEGLLPESFVYEDDQEDWKL